MKRRSFLSDSACLLGFNFIVSTPFASLTKAVASTSDEVKWGYVGKLAPEHWGTLSSQYKLCQTGLHQSPINFDKNVHADFKDFKIVSKQVPLKILNTGHTIQINTDPGNSLELDGISFQLTQFHFHHPSEHKVAGKSYAMELHLFHESAAGEIAVVGILIKQGKENIALKPIWNAMPLEKQPETLISGTTVDISRLLPKKKSTYRYFGSLTTPPCSELVRWVVFEQPIEASKSQIKQFTNIFPLNARPVHKLNQRIH